MVASMRGMHMAFGTMDIFVRRIDSIWYNTSVSVYVRFVLYFETLSIFSLWVASLYVASLYVASLYVASLWAASRITMASSNTPIY
jgi:hypothetical protein